MPTTTPATDWITLRDAAQRLQISEKSCRRWIAEGRLSAVRIGPRMIRVDAASVAALGKPLTAS